jgi:hypothetical protein
LRFTTCDLAEKYAGVIGKQYRTRRDAYLWKAAANQYDTIPCQLSVSDGYQTTRLELIPAGTILKVKSAWRSYKGGDWDYLRVEVRAPVSGKVYEFEELLGFSTSFPGDVAKRWEPVDKANTPAPLPNKGKLFHSPNARFSIDKALFPKPSISYSVTESQNPGSITFNLPEKGIVRIDYCTAPQQHLPDWAGKSSRTNVYDRTLDGVCAFVEAKTPGLKEFTLLKKRASTELGSSSAAVIRMQLSHGDYAGISHRGFITFAHGADSFVLHYQTGEAFTDDQTAATAMMNRLLKLKAAIIFHTPE